MSEERHHKRRNLFNARAMLIGLWLLSWTCNVQAENWTRFRGPNGTGHAGDVAFPSIWTDEDYLWKISLPGIGHSSPVGWENNLFLTSGDPETGAVTLLCYAADSGKQLWKREFAGQTYAMHASNSYASTSPTVDAKHVYVTWATGGKMHCAALTHDGQDVWQKELGEFVEQHGFAASPVGESGVICMQIDHADDGSLAGLDSATGKVLWRAERTAGKASYATACTIPMAGEGRAIISQSKTGGMQAIDVSTGKELWQLPDIFPARCVSSPFLSGKTIIGVCGGGGTGKWLVGMQLQDDPTQPPVEKFRLTKHVPYVPTPLAKDNLLFLWHDQGKISCVDIEAEDPSKLLWTKRIGGKFFGSPILAGNKIYCLSMEGKAVVIAADKEYKLLGENQLSEPSNATPAVHNGKMYLRTESSLACLAAE